MGHDTAKDKAEPVRVEKAFPSHRLQGPVPPRSQRLMRSRAPKSRLNPRRVSSSYLLSGLVKCHRGATGRSAARTPRAANSPTTCASPSSSGAAGACDSRQESTPGRFEELVVGKIRSNILTEGNIRALVKVVDERMDGVTAEQRKRLATIEDELEDVKRKLGRIWLYIESTDDMQMADASDRIREHRDRQERLEAAASEARTILSQRREVLDDVETISAYAQDMSEFLKESELTERRAFIETFVKEIVIMPGKAVVRYTVPMPNDSPIPGKKAEEMVLNGSVLSIVKSGPLTQTRTAPRFVNGFRPRLIASPTSRYT